MSTCDIAGELGMLGVPAFFFHEGGDPTAQSCFRQMAKLTRGAYCHFDASSAAQLKELLSAVSGRKTTGNIAWAA